MEKTKGKRKNAVIIALALLLICACALIVFLLARPAARLREGFAIDPGARDFEIEVPEAGGAADGIKIPGYAALRMAADDDTLKAAFYNPKGNPCYFVFSLLLDEGAEELYTSGFVPPGKSVTEEKLSRAVPKGEYPATIKILSFSLADQSPMNGANVKTVLYSN